MLSMKRALMLMMTVLFLCGASPALSATEYGIIIDGVGVVSDVKPEVKKGRTMVPIRVISEYLGADVKWSNGTATITNYNVLLQLRVNQLNASKNGAPYVLDVKPYLKNGRIYVPLRVIAETFGAKVHYEKGMVHLYSAPLFIEGRQVKIIEKEYQYTFGGTVEHISGNVHLSAMYHVLKGNTSAAVAAPTEYSWSPNLSIQGAFKKTLQLRFLDTHGESLAQYDIYHDSLDGIGSSEQREFRLHDVQADRWYAFSHTALEDIYTISDRAADQGLVSLISSTMP
ncbi:copper amine oxidase N-terminal domain-containing protein [Paenibacillus daejeonensis]|uniref:copper amine oxidase N-terminal domain-containing protein n=1 Tax=Paenibacillus daejeonensis TaxID=135193 RepID=UPI000368E10F|nr:copper amine oxidase N-terminal domain-containing protein [Paenibacillus daejeonensis]